MWTTFLLLIGVPRNDYGDVNRAQVKPVLDEATKEILAQKSQVLRLKVVADQHPFYRYNGLWTRELQNLVSWMISFISHSLLTSSSWGCYLC